MPEEKNGSRFTSWILPILIVIGIGGAFVYKFVLSGPSDPLRKAQLEPEGGLQMYLKHAYGYLTDASSMYDLEKVIPKEDYDWFQNNYSDLFQDTFDLRSAIDPNAGDAVARKSAMRQILSYGPNRESCPVISKKVADNTAEFVVQKRLDDGTLYNCTVNLVREGKYWKVKDFAGGKPYVLGDPLDDHVFAGYAEGSEAWREHQQELAEQGLPTAPPPGAAPGVAPQQPGAPEIPPEAQMMMAAEMQAMGNPMPTPAPAVAAPAAPAPTPQVSLSEYLSQVDAQAAQNPPASAPGAYGAAAPAGYQPGFAPSQPAQPGAAAPGSQPASPIETVDELIRQAGEDWNAQRFEDALAKAQQALELCKQHLGENHPKTAEVQGMVNAAQQQVTK